MSLISLARVVLKLGWIRGYFPLTILEANPFKLDVKDGYQGGGGGDVRELISYRRSRK